jgi:DNA-binding SARP family transcriptional activator
MSGMEANALHISLLPGFCCRRGRETIDLTDSQQKLIVTVALADKPVQREDLACRLWPDTAPIRAAARLRQGLWRLNQTIDSSGDVQLLQASHATVALDERVQVDFRVAMELIAPSVAGEAVPADDPGLLSTWHMLQQPLLPGWDLEWLPPHQESWDLRRVQALERLAETFLRREQHAVVLELADAAARADPLREGPRRIAIQSCLRAGEIADAHRRYRRYRELLREELGVSPSGAIPRMLWQARERSLEPVPSV